VVALACVAAVAFAPAKASATPVLWTLNATVVNVGTIGTASGSFVYDADTDVYSSIAITSTAPGASYSTNELGGTFAPFSPLGLQLIDGFVPGANLNKPTIAVVFSKALTNLGGSVSLSAFAGGSGLCQDNPCGGLLFANAAGAPIGGQVVGQVTGTPVASAVPEPATLFLCSAGLIGARVRRWRRRRA
jgi:hypothetical protein